MTTDFVNVSVPAPCETDRLDLSGWAEEHLYEDTGTGRTDGDAWYYLRITAATDPHLIGQRFDWGY